MNCLKVLCSCFEKNLKTLPRHGKVTGFCTFSHEKVKLNTEMKETFDPPESVHGMKVLDRGAFKKTITVPSVAVGNRNLALSLTVLNDYILKIHNFKPLQEAENDKKVILLNPEKVGSWNEFQKNIKEKLENLNIQEGDFSHSCIELGYENWKTVALLKAILPKDEPPLTSYSHIGHIIHLNLKDHLLEYKQIIGDILLDKTTNIRTVVNKTNIIDNTYRTFEMEVICGESDFMCSVKENNCIFEFDFSKVYWNSRLSTEHARIVNKINFGDALFDVFAGVGPFALPSAKKKCMVYANDLNPESFKWLNHNVNLNKKCKEYIKTYNKDGGDFILNDVKEKILKIWQDEFFIGNIHVVMNLPVMAATFIRHFKGLITEDDIKNGDIKVKCFPIVHCYFFTKGESEKEVFERGSGMSLDCIDHEFHFVRSVSKNKYMHRVTFTLPRNYLFYKEEPVDNCEPLKKRMCTS